MNGTLKPMTKAQAKKAVWLAARPQYGAGYRVMCDLPEACILREALVSGASYVMDYRAGHKIVAAIRNMLTTNAVMRVAAGRTTP